MKMQRLLLDPWADLAPPYDVIVADPAWRFLMRSPKGENERYSRQADKHYPCMTRQQLLDLPVQRLAAKHCHLWMWTPASHLLQAIELMTAWGFTYSSIGLIWVKLKKRAGAAPQISDVRASKGYTTRKCTELCLLGRRGQPKRASAAVKDTIFAPIREHSRKPDESRERIAQYCGPEARVVELFATSRFEGWDAWGNQLGRWDGPSLLEPQGAPVTGARLPRAILPSDGRLRPLWPPQRPA